MAVRPDKDLNHAILVIRTVETGQTVAVGRVVKDGNADKECQHAAAGEVGIGIVTAIGGNTGVTAGAAGDRVTVALLAGGCIIPVLVGTGGATRGAYQQSVADGVTDVTISGAGTTQTGVHGIALQTGVAGDMIGMLPAPGYAMEA